MNCALGVLLYGMLLINLGSTITLHITQLVTDVVPIVNHVLSLTPQLKNWRLKENTTHNYDFGGVHVLSNCKNNLFIMT